MAGCTPEVAIGVSKKCVKKIHGIPVENKSVFDTL